MGEFRLVFKVASEDGSTRSVGSGIDLIDVNINDYHILSFSGLDDIAHFIKNRGYKGIHMFPEG